MDVGGHCGFDGCFGRVVRVTLGRMRIGEWSLFMFSLMVSDQRDILRKFRLFLDSLASLPFLFLCAVFGIFALMFHS